MAAGRWSLGPCAHVVCHMVHGWLDWWPTVCSTTAQHCQTVHACLASLLDVGSLRLWDHPGQRLLRPGCACMQLHVVGWHMCLSALCAEARKQRHLCGTPACIRLGRIGALATAQHRQAGCNKGLYRPSRFVLVPAAVTLDVVCLLRPVQAPDLSVMAAC